MWISQVLNTQKREYAHDFLYIASKFEYAMDVSSFKPQTYHYLLGEEMCGTTNMICRKGISEWTHNAKALSCLLIL